MAAGSAYELVAEALDCEASTLSIESGLGKHPRWDSLGHAAVIVALEERCAIAVTEENIRRYGQMKSIVELFRRQSGECMGFDARWEDEIYGGGRMLNRYPSEVVVSFILSSFPAAQRNGRRVLDIGCGAGNNLCFLAREGFDVVGVDGSKTAIEFARNQLEREKLKAELVVGDFSSLELDNESIDCVIDRCSITHNRRAVIERVLDEVRRILKPGGLFFSQVFSELMADREFGRDLGDGSRDLFSAGYFANVGLTFFAARSDIAELYTGRFEERQIRHALVEDGAGRIESAVWNTVWRRS